VAFATLQPAILADQRVVAITAFENFRKVTAVAAEQAVITRATAEVIKYSPGRSALGRNCIIAALTSQKAQIRSIARQQQIIVAAAINLIHIDQAVIARRTGTSARAHIDRDTTRGTGLADAIKTTARQIGNNRIITTATNNGVIAVKPTNAVIAITRIATSDARARKARRDRVAA